MRGPSQVLVCTNNNNFSFDTYYLIFSHNPLQAPERENVIVLAPSVGAAVVSLWVDHPEVSASKSVFV